MVCRADFWCSNRHCKTSSVDLEGFWGQVLPNIGQKTIHKFPASLQVLSGVWEVPGRVDLRLSFSRTSPGWPENPGSVFGEFSAKLCPKTTLERRGSSCSAGRTNNQPGRPILRQCRGAKHQNNVLRPASLSQQASPSKRLYQYEVRSRQHRTTLCAPRAGRSSI